MEAEVFDLDDITMENIIFAMEDQAHSIVIDPESGQAEKIDEALDGGGRMVAPPMWTSNDGFNLMEDFLVQVRNPNARRELSSALGRGKGVFKAFKETLAAFPDVEKAFRQFKLRFMKRKIHDWYDDLREANGLERLGAEPEETEELLCSDLAFHTGNSADMMENILALLAEAEEDHEDEIPAMIVELSVARLREELKSGRQALCAVSDDDSGGILACALGFVRRSGARTYGSIEFIHVRKGFRRMGLGSAVLDMVSEALVQSGVSFIIVDSPLVPMEFASALAARGFKNFGIRATVPRG
jgi:ribosomal protein S18 acetylase RimI-like enzyme